MTSETTNSFLISLEDSFFTQYGKHFSPQQIKKNAAIPFKEHAELPLLVDILIRKYSNHVIIHSYFSSKMHVFFLEALLQHLTHDNIPYHLRDTELIYLDVNHLVFTPTQQKKIAKDFQKMLSYLESTDKCLLFAINNSRLFSKKHKKGDEEFLSRQFATLLSHPRCRFIILTSKEKIKPGYYPDDYFASLHLAGPSEADLLVLLKQQRAELENFHHILVPEEILTLAYSLAERYLSTDNTIEKTLLLLDSAAARTSTVERIDAKSPVKPILTTATLLNVLSGWTQIPCSHLQLHKFRLNEFIQGMQQRLFGQDIAITLIGHELQQSQAHLHSHHRPFCSLLFCGPAHTGRKSLALALAQQWFKQPNVLFIAQPTATTLHSLTDLRLQRATDKQYFSLQDVIHQTPYAIILLDNIEQASPAILEDIYEVLSTGYWHDKKGKQYNFRQASLILNTTLGAARLKELTEPSRSEKRQSGDLMHILMNEQKQNGARDLDDYSPQELANELMPEIAAHFSAALCQHVRIVPFLPLASEAIENIVHVKLELLGKTLDARYGIELGYAPEVIRHLANNVRQATDPYSIDIEKGLKQLYFTIEQAIFHQAENKNRSHQLFLQLNETGQLLRCDWLVTTAMRHHAT